MTMRLVIGVIGFTAVSLLTYKLNDGSFENLAEFRSGGSDGFRFSGPGFSSGGRTGLASVDGSRGAKFVAIEPKEPEPEQKSLRDRLFEAMGIHSGPDPREGDTLDALKMRQKDDMGELTVRDIGIDAKIKDVVSEIGNTDF